MRLTVVTSVLLVCSCAMLEPSLSAQGSDDVGGHRRSVVYARHGMVAASHPLAVEIGLQVLRDGGTAVDAAIATNAALGVLEPHACGIGGDLFALVWDAKEGRLHGLNASGPAPARATLNAIDREDGRIPLHGAHSWTVPGTVDGWATLHARFGKLPWKRLFEPSIRSAREGEPVPRVIAQYWKDESPRHEKTPGFKEVFWPEGRPVREGEIFRNERLAETYQQIAAGGRNAFYDGPIAKAIVAFSNANGGLLGREDLRSFRSQWVEPITTSYRGVDVYQLPPNGQGLAALQMLNILETFDIAGMERDSVELWHLMIEAKKLAFEDRARHYADPAFADVPVEALLDKEYARSRAALIDPKRASATFDAGDVRLDHGDTTYLSVVDREGNMVSLIQSVFWEFGSGFTVAGFNLQNRGSQFSLDPDSPNVLAPGKRPFHTIIPAFAMQDGKPWLSFGLMGGSMQPQGHAQVLINLIDFGMDLQQAGDAPRFRHSGSSQPNGSQMIDGGLVRLEAIVPESVRRGLEALGHRTKIYGSASFGGYQAIARDPNTGVLSGATESRKDGLALGY
ncbi:MAG: gamma-glutamyltransferase [Acidobacteriota bacterium]